MKYPKYPRPRPQIPISRHLAVLVDCATEISSKEKIRQNNQSVCYFLFFLPFEWPVIQNLIDISGAIWTNKNGIKSIVNQIIFPRKQTCRFASAFFWTLPLNFIGPKRRKHVAIQNYLFSHHHERPPEKQKKKQWKEQTEREDIKGVPFSTIVLSSPESSDCPAIEKWPVFYFFSSLSSRLDRSTAWHFNPTTSSRTIERH